MLRRSATCFVVALAVCAVLLPVAYAQVTVSVEAQNFAWTGKQGQQANYRWSAIIGNPSRRVLDVEVTLQLLDADGEVVASKSETTTLEGESQTTVDSTGSVAFADAETAAQYRIVLVEAMR